MPNGTTGFRILADEIAKAKREHDSAAAVFMKRLEAANRTIGDALCKLILCGEDGELFVSLGQSETGDSICIPAAHFANICNWFKKHYGDSPEQTEG